MEAYVNAADEPPIAGPWPQEYKQVAHGGNADQLSEELEDVPNADELIEDDDDVLGSFDNEPGPSAL